MSFTELARRLYPGVLAGANLAAGAVLYGADAPITAGVVSLCGLFVLAGIVSTLRPSSTPVQDTA
jgi:hypothetical protein